MTSKGENQEKQIKDIEPKQESIVQEVQVQDIAGQEQHLIYIGPSIPAKQLKQYDLFKGGIPFHLVDLFNDNEDLALLLAPVKEFQSYTQELKQSGSELNNAYKAIKGV